MEASIKQRGMELLCYALNGDKEGVKKILSDPLLSSSSVRDEIVNHQDETGLSPLAVASREGHLDVVKVLIEAKAKTDIRDARLRTPLLLAVEHGQDDVVLFLLQHCPEGLQQEDCYNRSVLHWACKKGNLKIVNALLQKQKQLQQQTAASTATINNNNNTTPVANGEEGDEERRREMSHLVNKKTTRGETPLFWALAGEEEGTTTATATSNTTPLPAAASSGLKGKRSDVEVIVEVLLEHGADPFVRNGMSQRPLEFLLEEERKHIAAASSSASKEEEGEGVGRRKGRWSPEVGEALKRMLMEKMRAIRKMEEEEEAEAVKGLADSGSSPGLAASAAEGGGGEGLRDAQGGESGSRAVDQSSGNLLPPAASGSLRSFPSSSSAKTVGEGGGIGMSGGLFIGSDNGKKTVAAAAAAAAAAGGGGMAGMVRPTNRRGGGGVIQQGRPKKLKIKLRLPIISTSSNTNTVAAASSKSGGSTDAEEEQSSRGLS